MRLVQVFCFFLIIQTIRGYFEQKIIRRAFDYDPDLSYKNFDEIDFPLCSKKLLAMKHNQTHVTQVCFQKDLFYNVELILGDKQTMEFSLDLTSPWTWFKSKSCKKCQIFNTDSFITNGTCKNSKKIDCTNDFFDANYDSPDWQDDVKTAQMFSDDQLVSGQFQVDKITFFAYNSSRQMNLNQYLSEKLGGKERQDKVSVDSLRMMNVRQIYGAQKYLCDGVLGLGFGFVETDEDEAEPDTDFLEKLIKQDTKLKLTRQRFSIYCLETGHYFPDYVVQFGGFDVKYAHQHSSDIVWLQRVPNSGYYWMVELNSFSMMQLNHVENDYTRNLKNNRGIFSLSSQFIELPKEELKYFLDTMNSFAVNTNCSIVDDIDLIVYCRNLIFPIHFIDLKFYFTFGGNKKIELASHLLYRNCTKSENSSSIMDCLLNIRYSKSGFVILGEPFMKWHYTIFDNEPGTNVYQIGLLPAATNMYYQEHPEPIFDPANWYFYKLVVYIFVFGIICMCCAANCRRGFKDCYRAYQQRKPISTEDQKKLRVKQLDDEMSSDIEEDYKTQEASQQKKKKDDWEKSNQQFNFQMKFDQNSQGSQQIEDSSI